jgi:GLPGLI family protein
VLQNLKNMKKSIFLICLIITTYAKSQNSGKIAYNYIAKGQTMQTCLIFNENKSVYKIKMSKSDKATKVTTKENKENGEGGEINIQINPYNNIPDNLGLFTNLETNTIIENKYYPQNASGILYDTIFVKDVARNIKWEIINETKQINSFVCHKAIGNLRGRTYTVWFTLDIPVSFGPWKLNGLPGLILEATDTKNEYFFYAEKIELNKETIIINSEDFENKNYITPKKDLKLFLESMAKIDDEIMQKIRASLPRGVSSTSSNKNEPIIDIETLMEFNFEDSIEENRQ